MLDELYRQYGKLIFQMDVMQNTLIQIKSQITEEIKKEQIKKSEEEPK